jgi:hypothetical protein
MINQISNNSSFKIIKSKSSRFGHTQFSFELFIFSLSTLDIDLMCLILKKFQEKNYQNEIEILDLTDKLTNLQYKPPTSELFKGSFLYAYPVSGLTKTGDSKNKNGKSLRLRAHKVSVPVNYSYVIYMGMIELRSVQKHINLRFYKPVVSQDVFTADAMEIKKFIIEYLELMKFDYAVLDDRQLIAFNKRRRLS